MASFQKRGKTWQYTISRMVNGKPKPIRKGGFKTKKEAQIAAAEVEAKLAKGINPVLKLEPINSYFEKWVNLYKSDVSKGTMAIYENTLRIINIHFQDTPLQHITKSDYQTFLNELGKTMSKETIRKINSHIRACVKDAIDEGIISVDFTRKAVIPGKKEKPPEEKYLNYEESQQLLNALYDNLNGRLIHYLLLLALTSGMRFAELVALTRQDFNFLNNTITVNKSWGYLPTLQIGKKQTKTYSSNRIIKMDKRTMAAFKNLFENKPDNIHRLVFYNPASKYLVYSNKGANKALKKLQESIGIENPVTIHGLRHTHASVLLYKGVSIQYISERLGHADIDTTLKKYAHMIKELRKQDEEKAVNIFEAM